MKHNKQHLKQFICKVLVSVTVLATLCFAGCDKKELEDITLPDTYLIEYEIVNEDNSLTIVSKGLDANGNYYYKNGTEEHLFMKEDTRFEVWQKTDGEWKDTNSPVKKEYIDTFTVAWNDLALKSPNGFGANYQENGEQELAGRNCTAYTYSITIVNFITRFEMLVEEDSGICLKHHTVSIVQSKETQRVGYECTKYVTENIDFSSLK